MARYTVSLLQFMKPRGTCVSVFATSLRGLITVTCCWFQKNVLVLPEPYWRYMHEAKMCTHAMHALIPRTHTGYTGGRNFVPRSTPCDNLTRVKSFTSLMVN